MRQLLLGRDDQKRPRDLMLALEIAQKVDQSDPFAQTFLIGKNDVFIGEKGLLEAVKTALLQFE